jgi:hypothetical protein
MVDQAEDAWGDDDAWLEARYRCRRAADEDVPAGSQQPAAPVEEELPGSVYFIPHRDWKNVRTRRPKDRPGVCVACDVAARWAWLYRGLDAGSPVLQDHETIIVPPSKANGLDKPTGFIVEPQGIRLHRLLTYHNPSRLIGRLEDHYLQPMQDRFLEIIQANRRGDL